MSNPIFGSAGAPTRTPHDVLAEAQNAVSTLKEIRGAVQAKLARLDPDLPRHVQKLRTADVRREGGERAARTEKHVASLRDEAENMKKRFAPEAFHRRAVFDADPAKHSAIGVYWQGRLARMGETGLRDVARDAQATGNVALAQAVHEEARGRNASRETRAEIGEILAKMPTGAEPLLKILDQAVVVMDDAERLAEEIRGQSNPMAKVERGMRRRQLAGTTRIEA